MSSKGVPQWWVPYAAFTTLLFALFVVLYAVTKSELGELQKKASEGSKEAASQELEEEGEAKTASFEPGAEAAWKELKGRMLDLIRDRVSQSLGPGAAEEVLTEDRGDQFIVRLSVAQIFKVNQFRADPDLHPLFNKIGEVLAKIPNSIRIEGHADYFEKKPKGFSTAWELSMARAKWLFEFWRDKVGLDSRRVILAGGSYHHPLQGGARESLWKTGVNRRVEIAVLNQVIPQDDLKDRKE